MARLQRYRWPGNVRELRNVIERVVIMAPGRRHHRARPGVPRAGARRRAPRPTTWRRRPCRCTPRAISSSASTSSGSSRMQQGNISRTAEVLGVERSNLYRKMRAFGIAPSRRPTAGRQQTEEAVVTDEVEARSRVAASEHLRSRVASADSFNRVTGSGGSASAGTSPTISLSSTATPSTAASRSTASNTVAIDVWR